MKGLIFASAVVAFVVGMTAMGIALSLAQNNQSPIPSGGQGTTTITLTNGVVNHPPGCNDLVTNVVNGLSLLMETTTNPSVGSQICIHVVLTNLNPQPLPVYQDLLAANVTDMSGQVVYHITWGITTPPDDPHFSLVQGKFWEDGVYWNTSKSIIPLTAGTYHITAMLLVPTDSTAYKPAIPITSTVDVNLLQA
ncbi:MAG: hypothetical protein ACREBS_06770 [Nitrososphaerales archaeon]